MPCRDIAVKKRSRVRVLFSMTGLCCIYYAALKVRRHLDLGIRLLLSISNSGIRQYSHYATTSYDLACRKFWVTEPRRNAFFLQYSIHNPISASPNGGVCFRAGLKRRAAEQTNFGIPPASRAGPSVELWTSRALRK